MLDRGDRVSAGPATGLLGHLAFARGRPVTAIRLLSEATGHLEGYDSRGLAVAVSGQIAQAYALVGDARRACQADAEARRRLHGRAVAWHEDVVLTRARAWVLTVTGEPTRAGRLLLDHAAQIPELPVFRSQLLSDALSIGASPGAVSRQLADVAAACDAPLAHATADHAAALASGDPAGLLRAARSLEQIGALLSAAEAAARAAALLTEQARPSAARRASAISVRLLDRCEGAITPALCATRPGRTRLTRREREFAELAAQGHSNAQIAGRLTVSIRTVESHLYHAMSKLGVTRRDRIAAALDDDSAPAAGSE